MAKKSKSVVNMSLLTGIGNGSVMRVSEADGLALREAGLIEVNVHDIVDGLALCRITEAGKAALPNGKGTHEYSNADTPLYAVMTNVPFVPSERKRGGGGRSGAKTIYPWATMEVGHTFFVPVSAKHDDPVKSMTSAVSSANMKYSEEVGEPKEKTRAKRGPGNKAVLDGAGHKIMETVWRKDRKALRKFDLKAVSKGEQIGEWIAPADGALIARVV